MLVLHVCVNASKWSRQVSKNNHAKRIPIHNQAACRLPQLIYQLLVCIQVRMMLFAKSDAMRKDHSVWRKNSSTSRLGYRLVAKSVHERMYSARKLNTNEWHTDTLHTHTQARAHKTHKTHIGIVRLECRLLASSIPAFHSIVKYIAKDVLRRSRPMRCFFFSVEWIRMQKSMKIMYVFAWSLY